ncbi:FAD-binding domain-containing protein [Ophiobolus disseminans]|uniref:FAD-binding domain-containing protein n=1 Tax=Ophiobolus disseminans TaxID=1469910 RepID=A0A6A7AHY6_9PLEO|nr:FAD-binding domain-containing protein [Ophiobolus disseminans]
MTILFSILTVFSVCHAVVQTASVPLFDYEKTQLTDYNLAQLPAEHQAYFSFEDSAGGSSFVLKSGECRVQPTDDDYPPPPIWKYFKSNMLLKGAVIDSRPLASPCYLNWGNWDKSTCEKIVKNWGDPYLHEADPTSSMFPVYQGRTCLPRLSELGANATCELGAYPAHVVNVSTVAHIQIALNFARNANIRLVIKNTGHDFLGKSLGAGALSIWTHHLKNMEFIEHYNSSSGYEGSVFKVGAGVVVREIYKAAEKYNVTVTGGICESVGFAGGYIAGGGHTPMSGYYGMAADNIEELQVVTADGHFVTASSTSYPDLFWALRGGGGSTFGIVTSVIVRAHPKTSVVTSTFTYSTGGNITKEIFWQGLRKWWEMFPALADAHTYSYFWVYAEPNDQLTFQMMPFWAPGHTIETSNKLLAPLFTHLRSLGIQVNPKTTLYDSFYAAYKENWGNETVGYSTGLPGNRLFPRSNWEDPVKFERMYAAIKKQSMGGQTVGGYHQAPQNRLNVDNAVSSAWRHALSMMIGMAMVEGGDNATAVQMKEAARELTEDILGPWRDVAPESDFGGAYGNEANVVEPQWQSSFYGTQYERLLEIKRKWDPQGLFYAPTGVGSEGWEVRDGDWGTQTQNGRLCRI